MWHRIILVASLMGAVVSGAAAMPETASPTLFHVQLNALTSALQRTSTNSSGMARSDGAELPTEHPWGGAVWLDDGYVTIDKADLGPVAARRPAFTLGFQRLPQDQCRLLMGVRGGENVAGSGVLQVSAKNIETDRFVSFKGARLDTTLDQVDIACEGRDDLFTVTVTFDYHQ